MTKKTKTNFFTLLLLFFIFCFSSGFSLFPCYLSPFEGKVIDADTKTPIEEAAVLAVYHGSTISVAGSNIYPVDAQETLTDANGEFKISAKTVWFGKVGGWPEGNIIIFKPGYGTFPNHKQSESIGVNKSWPPPNKCIVYELPKLKTREERKDNLIFSRPDIPYKKMRNFINLINEEYSDLGLPGVSIPQEEK